MQLNEKKERLKAILKGAFAGPPTPLKDIPTRSGKSRRTSNKTKTKQTKKNRVRARSA